VKESKLDLTHQQINILTCIMGFAEMAKREPEPEKKNVLLDQILFAVKRGAEIEKRRAILEGILND